MKIEEVLKHRIMDDANVPADEVSPDSIIEFQPEALSVALMASFQSLAQIWTGPDLIR